MAMLKQLVRRGVEAAGYRLDHRSVLPFGVDPHWDIQRLADRHDFQIRMVFDIGAHVGQTARGYLDAFPDAQVHSFEPHPNSFNCLVAIKSDRLHPHRLALSDKCGEAVFNVMTPVTDADHAVAASMNNSLVRKRQFGLVEGNYEHEIKVDCVTVDAFCSEQDIRSIDLLKIDVEGAEAAVLDGAAGMLDAGQVRSVFIEWESVRPIRGATGGDLAAIAKRLEPRGFRLMASYPNHVVDEPGKPLYACFNALFLAPG